MNCHDMDEIIRVNSWEGERKRDVYITVLVSPSLIPSFSLHPSTPTSLLSITRLSIIQLPFYYTT